MNERVMEEYLSEDREPTSKNIALWGDLTLLSYFERLGAVSPITGPDSAKGCELLIIAWPRLWLGAPCPAASADVLMEVAESRGVPVLFVPPNGASAMEATLSLARRADLVLAGTDRKLDWYSSKGTRALKVQPIPFAGIASWCMGSELADLHHGFPVSPSGAVNSSWMDHLPSQPMMRVLLRHPNLLFEERSIPFQYATGSKLPQKWRPTVYSHGVLDADVRSETAGPFQRSLQIVTHSGAESSARLSGEASMSLRVSDRAWAESGFYRLQREMLQRFSLGSEWRRMSLLTKADNEAESDAVADLLLSSESLPRKLVVRVRSAAAESRLAWRLRPIRDVVDLWLCASDSEVRQARGSKFASNRTVEVLLTKGGTASELAAVDTLAAALTRVGSLSTKAIIGELDSAFDGWYLDHFGAWES